MIELIRDLASLLVRDNLLIDEIVAKVGRVERDPGSPLPAELRPALPGVQSAKLSLYPDTGLPYALSLELMKGSQPTVGEMKASLGNYKRSLTGRGQEPELIFSSVETGAAWRIAIVANMDRSSDDLDSARVTRVIFRRDPIGKNF
jgi:hypothetical protein